VQDEAACDEGGVRDRCAAAGADGNLTGAALGVEAAHFAHGLAVEDFRHRLAADVADG